MQSVVDLLDEFQSARNLKHTSLDMHRIGVPGNELEQKFLVEWNKQNKRNGILGYLLSTEVNEEDWTDVTSRDMEVAATVIQWLGSSCGQVFLRDCGFEFKGEKR
jgi:hypothetical protein